MLHLCAAISLLTCVARADITYPIVDTNQRRSFGEQYEIVLPKPGEAFYGQDANYLGNAPKYRKNDDGTVSDLVTGLMWTADPGEKITFAEAVRGAEACRVGGYDDWRLPSVKELYSLMQFNGLDHNPQTRDTSSLVPFINNDFFVFTYGDVEKGERTINSQYATAPSTSAPRCAATKHCLA